MAANPDGTVTVVLKDDRKFRLKFDFNAIAELELATGRSLFKGDVFDLSQIADIRALLYAGLKWTLPKLTLTEAGNLLPPLDVITKRPEVLQPIIEALMEAVTTAMPQPALPEPEETKTEGLDEEAIEGNVRTLPSLTGTG